MHLDSPLVDGHNRPINYLRLAVTDRCNLRCAYCMPPAGIRVLPHQELLSFEEILRLVALFTRLGIGKVRITGGEPFVRRDLPDLLAALRKLAGLEQLHITTNGVLTGNYLETLQKINISGINLSIDTFRTDRFREITRRDQLPAVLATLRLCLAQGVPLKINTVVQPGNLAELGEIARLAKAHPVEVRFIEPMPFNGGRIFTATQPQEAAIREILQKELPPMTRILGRQGTAALYEVQGFRGRIGVIAGYSRQFCGHCNKIRLTPDGGLKTCLYGKPVLNLKELLRTGCDDGEIVRSIHAAVAAKPLNGMEAAAKEGVTDSMATIGG